MNHVLAIAKKELRAYFLSPVALIFLFTFLVTTVFIFFWIEGFFARNLADVRPLFTWLPVLLIFLVSALTMRLWSEEQKLGTLEILLTLPVDIHKLVLGKFLAGLALVGLALALTLGIPITVSMMGDLDWGPVFGGYFGALLLAGAYLAIGLCISSLTENQIVALIVTVLACAVIYLVGADPVVNLAGNRGGEILRALGTGSRFESIRRGVIDIRDIAYYASLIVSFLVLNTVILKAKRWSEGAKTASQRTNARLMVGLVALNLLALNIWLASVGFFRIDLTQKREYSISPVTKNMIRSLDSPLLIRGYFSGKTHPLLAPLVPRIRDLIEEYGVVSRGTVKTEFVDPKDSPDLEKEANEAYGIKSFPFRVADRYEAGVVNSYFSILVKYGDQYDTLSFEDLIEVNAGAQSIEVKLRNLEYDLTRSIKKVAYGFQTLEAVFAGIDSTIEFTAYITPKTLPDNFKQAPANIEKVLKEIEAQSGGKFKWKVVDPDATPGDQSVRQDLFRKYGFRPMSAGLFSQDTFYLHLLLRVGDKYQQIFPAESASEADLKKEITAALKRSTPGFLKTIGFVKPKTDAPPMNPHMPQQQPPPDITRILREKLGQNYTLKDLDLKDGRVPGDVDALLVVAPKDFDDKQQFALDQYLMRGGTVILLGGKYELDISGQNQEGLAVKKVTTGLEGVLSAYGVTIQDSMVLDPQNEAFPIPIVRDLGGLKVRDIQLVRYPFFVDVRKDGMDQNSPVVGGLPAVTLHWASPVIVGAPPKPAEGEQAPKREVVTLLSSSPGSWTQSDTAVQPDFQRYGEMGFATGTEKKSFPLAVAITGKFESAFKDRPSPLFGADAAATSGQQAPDRTGRTLKSSPETARLVVVGSGSFVEDMVLNISRQTGNERYQTNLQLVENLSDWAVADTDLLTIRSRGTYARTLVPMDAAKRRVWELVNYAIVLVGLGVVVALSYGRRKRLTPITLDPSDGRRSGPIGGASEARS